VESFGWYDTEDFVFVTMEYLSHVGEILAITSNDLVLTVRLYCEGRLTDLPELPVP